MVYKDVVAVVGTLLVVGAAVIAVNDHFAKKSELERMDCRFSFAIEQLRLGDRLLKLEWQIGEVEREMHDADRNGTAEMARAVLDKKAERLQVQFNSVQTQYAALDSLVASGECRRKGVKQ